jgi:hypothetical protein
MSLRTPLIVAIYLVTASLAFARPANMPDDKQMSDQADLMVIATPTDNADLPGPTTVPSVISTDSTGNTHLIPAIRVQTTFRPIAIPGMARTAVVPEPPAVRREQVALLAAEPTPPDMEISLASIVVRAHVAGWKETTVEYAVDRVMLGDMPDKSVQLDITSGQADLKKLFAESARKQLHDRHPDPTDEELTTEIMREHSIAKDQQVILALNPPSKPAAAYEQVILWGDNPPYSLLVTPETQIMQAIHSGRYLEFYIVKDHEDYLLRELERSDAVVRATLLESSDKAATWRINKTLKGKDLPATVEIAHDIFRQRAQSWVDYLAVKDAALIEPGARQARIKEEMAAMMTQELTPDRRAILFLSHVQKNRADMVGRVYGDNLKDLEEAIIHPPEVRPRL